MASRAANKRLTREYKTISENPPPYIIAHPSEANILEWHYILTGPPETPYHNGQYWGTLIFPPNYPFAPPAIRMHTPSGRFQQSHQYPAPHDGTGRVLAACGHSRGVEDQLELNTSRPGANGEHNNGLGFPRCWPFPAAPGAFFVNTEHFLTCSSPRFPACGHETCTLPHVGP